MVKSKKGVWLICRACNLWVLLQWSGARSLCWMEAEAEQHQAEDALQQDVAKELHNINHSPAVLWLVCYY